MNPSQLHLQFNHLSQPRWPFALKNPQIPSSEAPVRTKDQILMEHPRASLVNPRSRKYQSTP